MIKVIRRIEEWRTYREKMVGKNTLGFVPTLGGLHQGHLALIRRAMGENDVSVVSIFLNRVQFNNEADFISYPSDFSEDLMELEEMGVDVVFAPDFDTMYPDGFRYRVTESKVAASMEGSSRPGHFDGVLTVVLKLLNLIKADRAYFGEKDYQQLSLVKGMVEAFFLETEIIPCETVRAIDGLALSSRNRRLSQEGRRKAALFPKILESASTDSDARTLLEEAGFEVEYVESHDKRRYGAVILEGVRLIDNWPLGIEVESGGIL